MMISYMAITQSGTDLVDYFGVELPWGKSLTLQEYVDFISQEIFQNTNLCKEYLENELLMDNTGAHLYNASIKFIERKSKISDSLVSSIFDYYKVPSGTDYECELPEYLRYWKEDFSGFEYDNYRKHPIKVEKYEEIINDIFNKVGSNTDELI